MKLNLNFLMLASLVTLMMGGIFVLKPQKNQIGNDMVTHGEVAPHQASFEFTRQDHQGESRRYSIDCPGTSLCMVEIKKNNQVAAQTTVDWSVVQEFFNSYSTQPFIHQPSGVEPGERVLVDWQFRLDNLSRHGALTMKNLDSAGVTEWESLVLSFF